MSFRPAPIPDFDLRRHNWSVWNDRRNQHRRARYHGQMRKYYVSATGFRNFFYLRKADAVQPDSIVRCGQTSKVSFPVTTILRMTPYTVQTAPTSCIESYSHH